MEKYTREHLNEDDKNVEFGVYVVWHCFILGNAKWMISTTLRDGMYYEVTYNRENNEMYLDAYKKEKNICISLV